MGVNDMDIVEFVEKVCEFSLTDFQKEFVRKVYDAAKTIDEIGQLIDIPMKDFMMIGSETYYSVKENGDI